MKKICLSLLMAVLFLAGAARAEQTADGYPRVLVVCVADGSQHVFSLTSKPKVTFGQQVVTFANDEISVTYPCTEVQKYYFVSQDNPVVSIRPTEAEKQVVRQISRYVYEIDGENSVAGAMVADMGGRSYANCVSKTSNGTRIDLSRLPKGIYTIHFSKARSLKIIRR